jgi:TRAP transporter TAXI family solute receptor
LTAAGGRNVTVVTGRRNAAVAVAALVAAVVGLAANPWAVIGRDGEPEVSRLVIASGGLGGVYHAYGTGMGKAALRRYPDAAVKVLETDGSLENLRLLGKGQADVGFALADSAAAAVSGTYPFTRPLQIRAIAQLYDDYAQLVVPAGSPVRRLGDLRGHRVSTGAPGSGTGLIAERLLHAAGLDPDSGIRRKQYDITESATALRDGKIDALFFAGGLPTPAIKHLAAKFPVRLIDLAGYVAKLQADYGEFYTERMIPASTYRRMRQEVATIGVPNYLVVSAAMEDGAAYAVTRLLFGAESSVGAALPVAYRLDRRVAISTSPVQLHPGAARYYRETKS